MLVYGEDEYVTAWVVDQLPHVENFGKSKAIGVVSQERLIAGCVYSDYRPRFGTIEMSIASVSPMWARRENIAGLLKYPFEQLGVFKVYAASHLSNEKALKVNAHIGFTREAVLAHQFGKGHHAVIMRMLLPDYERLWSDTK